MELAAAAAQSTVKVAHDGIKSDISRLIMHFTSPKSANVY